MKLYVSGYGGGAVPSIGVFTIDYESILENTSISYVENSTYLSIYQDYIFGISEIEGNSQIHMFRKNISGYTWIDSKTIKGGLLCHINYLSKNKVLVGACYETGEIFTIEVGESGFGEILSFIRQGENKTATSRAHCVVANKSETLLYSANIALDTVYSYKLHQGKLLENDRLVLSKGEGPRHILLNNNEDTMYVISEYSNKIFVVKNDKDKMTLVDSVSTLPEDFRENSYCSTLCMTANGKFIYAANRGADTIAVFNVFEDGKISKLGDCPCFGNWPRHITLVNNYEYLAIANQGSDEIVLSKINPITGLLTNEIINIPFHKPSYVVEVYS